MTATTLTGDTLGKKHHEYNNLLNEAIQSSVELKDLSLNELDVNNLLQIDIACHNKNVDYILKVLKSDDMLYVSRAIRNSTWLITENQYENIINPEYLHTTLFPEMTTKACIKLRKNIMHNLLDESRVEYFYKKAKCQKIALKWLLGCSIPFIEENIGKHCEDLNTSLFKRFCEKSVSIFKVLSKVVSSKQSLLNSAMFLVYSHTDVYLEVLESCDMYERPDFNARATKYVMKHCPERIINNFHIYVNIVNIKVFARYLPKENIKSFLYNLAHEASKKSRYNISNFLQSSNIFFVIRQIHKQEQYEFVKKMFIDDIDSKHKNKAVPLESELCQMKSLRDIVRLEKYVWYQFAPFDVAFEKVKFALNDSSDLNKNGMLLTLIKTFDNKLQNVQTSLNFIKDNHKKYPDSTKLTFLSDLIKHVNVNKFDNQTWNVLNEVFKCMDVFEEPGTADENCIITIILYHVIHKIMVPQVIEKKFNFNSLKSYCKLLNKEEKTAVFNYLHNYLLTKIGTQYSISNESEFTDAVKLIKTYLHLLLDWEKELLDHPNILIKIRNLIQIRQKNSWKLDLSPLYNVKKSWRKLMFEESLALCPSENVCINVLKHDPTLLYRCKNEVELIRINEEVSLQNMLSKIRIFWPQSLATEWINVYLERLNVLGGHKAVIKGLCSLLMQNQLLDVIKKYAPKDEKINWSDIDELTLSLQRHIAKNMHTARPQPGANAILLYAKGDYLSYALPSLLAIFYNMNLNLSRENLMKLLDTRVSIQKHIIRFAFAKLEHGELINIFSIVWKNSKNATIRCIIFKYTFNLLCVQEIDDNIKGYAELLETFIDNLTSKEDDKIYALFNKVDKIPLIVRPNILMKSYKLLKRLVHDDKNSKNFEGMINTMRIYFRNVMELLSTDFATEIVNDYINGQFFTDNEYIEPGYGMINVLSAYILSAKDMETQTKRYENVLKPLIQRCLNLWNDIQEGQYFIQKKLKCLLSTLIMDLKFYMKNINFEITHSLFSNIQSELEHLPIPENYIILTIWKLVVELTKLLRNVEVNSEQNELMFLKCASEFGKICLKYLKSDVETYFPCIYVLFVKALDNATNRIFTQHEQFQIYESMLMEKEFLQAYLGVIKIFPQSYNIDQNLKSQVNAFMENFSTHTSVEVKMHYYNRFQNEKN